MPFVGLDERRIQQLQAFAANKRRRANNGQRRAALARWDEDKARAAVERHTAILARLGPIAAQPLADPDLEARIALLSHDA